jgi:hypothetical protein
MEKAYALVFVKDQEVARGMWNGDLLIYDTKKTALAHLEDYQQKEEDYELEIKKVTISF